MAWGVYDYPSPPEKEYQVITGKIYVCYDISVELPAKWDKEEIYDYVQSNVDECIQLADMTIENIDI